MSRELFTRFNCSGHLLSHIFWHTFPRPLNKLDTANTHILSHCYVLLPSINLPRNSMIFGCVIKVPFLKVSESDSSEDDEEVMTIVNVKKIFHPNSLMEKMERETSLKRETAKSTGGTLNASIVVVPAAMQLFK